MKKIYRALAPYNYESKGETKTGWTEVGVAFPSKDGEGVNVELRPGISVSGRLVIRPIELPKEAESNEQAFPRFVHDLSTPIDDLI